MSTNEKVRFVRFLATTAIASVVAVAIVQRWDPPFAAYPITTIMVGAVAGLVELGWRKR